MKNKLVAIFSVLMMGSSAAFAAPEVVFTEGQTKILVDYQKNKMYCTYCGFGDEMRPITGTVPQFEGSTGGVQNYFKDKGILIVRTDMGTSCPSGAYTAIDLTKRIAKDLDLPNCAEEKATYSTENGKAIMKVKQGKKTTVFAF